MGYPVRWRGGRPSMSSALGGLVPSLPARGTWYMPPKPPMRFPRFGWLLAAGIVADVLLNSDRQNPAVPVAQGAPTYDWTGWTHICGPAPACAPSICGSQFRWQFSGPGGGCNFATCGTGGQSLGTNPQFDNAASIPAPGADCAILWQGPAPGLLPLERFYSVEQKSRPGGGLAPPVIVPVRALPIGAPTVPVGVPVPAPLYISVGVAPMPVRWAPYVALPQFPEESDRGWRLPPIGLPPIGSVIPEVVVPPKPDTKPNPPIVVVPVPWWVDVKTPSYDREVKMADPTGRLATMFKALSFYGSVNSIIDALWSALPNYARTAHARTASKYADVFAAMARGDFDAGAFSAAVGYYLNYKAAGELYGTAFRAAQGIGRGGVQLYRSWATGEYVGSGISNLFRSTAAQRVVSSAGQTRRDYVGRRTIEARFERDLQRVERDFRRSFTKLTSGQQTYALQRRRQRIRSVYQARRRSLKRHGYD